MTKVIGVRFRTAGKIYFFSPGKFEVKRGDQVIVETARGVEFGNVVMGPKEVKDEEITQPLKTVIRLATEDDRRVEEKNRKKEKEAFHPGSSQLQDSPRSVHFHRSSDLRSRSVVRLPEHNPRLPEGSHLQLPVLLPESVSPYHS